MTSRSPFEPADGESARWQKLYDLVLTKNVDDQITYTEAEELLGIGQQGVLGAMWLARRHLEANGQLSVRTVRNYGWIVMAAAEHIGESDRHLKKAHNQAKTALRKVTAIDGRREELSQFEREAADRAKLRAIAVVKLRSHHRPTFAELQQEEQKRLS